SVIKNAFHLGELNVSERLSTVEVSFVVEYQSFPNIETIQSLLSSVPQRDMFSLTCSVDSGEMVCVTNHQVETPDFSTITIDLTSEDNITIRIQIDKAVGDEKFSIYDFPSFTNDLLQRPVLEVLCWFSERLRAQKHLKFEVFDYDISFSTRTLAFESSENATFKPKIDRHQRVSACRDMACFYNMSTFEVVPDDFIIEGVMRAGDCLKPLFGKLATILSLAYVATSASVNDRVLTVQISGQRTTSYELLTQTIQEDEKWLNIYTWIFTDGNPTDKALIARNVISLHCKYHSILDLDGTVFEAIKSNYSLYLRDNVNQYLDMKRDIAKFIQDIVAQVGDYAMSILAKFKTNLIAIFGFLFTVVLTRVGSTQKWLEIFTRDTIYIIEIFLCGSLIYLFICIFEIRYKLKKAEQGYNELKKNYESVLSNLELKEAFNDDKLLHDTKKNSRHGIIGWSVAWGGVLVLIIIMIEVFTTNHGILVWVWNRIPPLFSGAK
ncbi:MAG: hypothetical protein ABFC56_14350, partial [Clostridiaceae bacterium]